MSWSMQGFSGEQMSQQLYALSEVLYANKHWIGRDLVEPQLISQPRDSSAYEEAVKRGDRTGTYYKGTRSIPWSDLFRMDTLDAYFRQAPVAYRLLHQDECQTWCEEENRRSVPRTVSLDAFHRASNFVFDQVVIVGGGGDWRMGPNIDIRTGRIMKCANKGARVKELGPATLEFYGREYAVKRVSCWASIGIAGGSVSVMKRIVSAIDTRAQHVALSIGRGMLQPNWVDWKPLELELEYRDTSRAFVPDGWVDALATRMLAQLFSGDATSYMAVHWRRGDYKYESPGAIGTAFSKLSAPANVAKRICQLARAANITRAFLMTNSNNATDIGALIAEAASCATIVQLPAGLLSDWRLEQHRMIVEQTIAVRATAFLANGPNFWKSSAVSRFVIERRMYKNGKLPTRGRTNDAKPGIHFMLL